MSASIKRPPSMMVHEFLDWEPGDGRRYDLVDGEPRAMAPTGTVHAFLLIELGSRIRDHLQQRRPNCVILSGAGVIPRVNASRNFRIPDLGVTCAALRPGQRATPEPLLLIEILSPSNKADTWSNVWTYTTIPTVREILVLDSTRTAAQVLRRDRLDAWPDQPDLVVEGALELASIDFRVALIDLYAATGVER